MTALSRWKSAVPGDERRRWALGTFGAAVAFRALLLASRLIDAVFDTNDSWEYRDLALSMLRHHVFGLEGVPKMNRTPGYPAFLAVLFGTIGSSRVAVTTVQIALDALTCVMVVDILVRARATRLACATAATLAATCLFTAAYSYQLMTETFYAAVLAAGVWVLPSGGFAALVRRSALGRVATSGFLAGVATLIRPSSAVTIVAFPALAAMVMVWRFRRRAFSWQALYAGAVFVMAAAIVVAPWMLRNRVVFRAEFDKPEHPNATLLGYKTDIPTYRHWYTPQFMHFQLSFEEPWIMESPYRAPSIVRYVYPEERDETQRAFADLQREIMPGDAPITRQTLDEFAAIADKRYASAPRLYVTAPLSRVAKFWIAPRVSVLWRDKHGGNVNRWLTVGLTLYDCVFALLGFAGLARKFRGAYPAWLGIVAIVASQTALYCVWHGMPQSRYAVPMLPFLCLGAGVFAERVSHRYPRRSARVP